MIQFNHSILLLSSIWFLRSDAAECPSKSVDADIEPGDTVWLLICSALVLLMTPGLAFYYSGLVRKKNVVNTLMMSYISMGVICVQFVLVGYSFAFSGGNSLWGSFSWGGLNSVGVTPNADYSPTVPHIAFMHFQMMFAIIAPALTSGGIVERVHFRSYVAYIFLWSTLVYDPLAHWVWAGWSEYSLDGTCEFKTGWLRDLGALDFAGGTVIHISSGFATLMGSIIVGKRADYDPTRPIPPSNVPFVLLGTAFLWVGWLGFNGGSALTAGGIASLAVANSTISAAAGFITWLFLDSVTHLKPSAVGSATGAVVGLVTVTPACGYILPGFAILFGMIGSVIVYYSIKLKPFIKVDDSLDVFFSHGIGGVAGALLTGLFSSKAMNPAGDNGLFYGNPKLLGAQVVATIVTAIWSISISSLILLLLKYTIGLRTHHELELEGLDIMTHGEVAESPAPIAHWAKTMYNRSFRSLKFTEEAQQRGDPPIVKLDDQK